MYINTSGVPATQPASPVVADSAGNDVSNVGDVIMSNSFIQTGLQEAP
ncbi:MAG: hypothetical protein IPL53_19500 [Ignavibacteria bacterium]|nr:hypothetical protein [Ignavibacteria bacterium]